jgi:hypothetical protein
MQNTFQVQATQKYTNAPTEGSFKDGIDKQIILNPQIIAPDAPVPTKNIPTNSPPSKLAIAIEVFY